MKKKNDVLYLFTIVATLVALAVMVLINYDSFYSSMNADMQEIGNSSLQQVTEKVESYLVKGMDVVDTTAISVEYMMNNGAASKEIENYLVYESERYKTDLDEHFTGVYGLFNNVYIDGIGWVPDEDYNPREREWYIAAEQQQGKSVLVSPYLDAQTNTIMISVSKMLSDGDSVISLDITLEQIQDIVSDIQFEGLAYGFVVDKNGLVVAHTNEDEIGAVYLGNNQDMNAILEKVYKEEQACFQMTMGEVDYRVFSDTVMTDWHVVMVVNEKEMLKDVNEMVRDNFVLCSIISVFIIVFYIFTYRKMKHILKLELKNNLKMQQNNQNIIRALARAIDAKDHYTNGHSVRVAEYARAIAKRMNKTAEEQEQVYYAGLLHDVGKIRVPEGVINKPGKLTDDEFDMIKLHPVTGYHILSDISDETLIAEAAKYHHERYDGKGYPNGIAGNNIPEMARILAVADSYDAMASNRSYRNALPQDVVRQEIEKGKGTQFDPNIADIMLQMIDEDKEYQMKQMNAKNKTILVVDDDIMNHKMIENIMLDEPIYILTYVESGMAALEELESHRYDLILLDVMMPEMDGLETLKCIRRKYDTPVVLMTGDKNLDTSQGFSELGCDDYITKPFLPHILKEIIYNIAQKSDI